ncbi:MAG TPA: DUF4112 domain-containing protein [Gemmatimonadales bacterium]
MTQPARHSDRPIVGAYPAPELDRLRAVSRLLDNAFTIPGTNLRFGFDALIGLVPGIGDALGALFSAYLILQARRLGAPKSVINRMIANVGVDTVVGWVPVLGDLFDVGWKANNKNLALLEQHLQQPAATRAASKRSLLLLGGGLLVALVGIVAVGVLVAQLVLNLLQR